MPFVYKIDILKELKDKGYSTYRLRKEKILSENTISKIRRNELISITSMEIICRLLQIDIGDLIQLNQEEKKEGK